MCDGGDGKRVCYTNKLCSTLIHSDKASRRLCAAMAMMTQGTMAMERVSSTLFHLAHLMSRNPSITNWPA